MAAFIRIELAITAWKKSTQYYSISRDLLSTAWSCRKHLIIYMQAVSAISYRASTMIYLFSQLNPTNYANLTVRLIDLTGECNIIYVYCQVSQRRWECDTDQTGWHMVDRYMKHLHFNTRGTVSALEVCGMTLLFPFPSHCHRIIPIPIPGSD